VNTFHEFQIQATLIEGLHKENIITPTPVQEAAIPIALGNQDLLATAATGSGKTLAYLLPAFARIDSQSKELNTLILAPTHELVVQINTVIKRLSKNAEIPVRSTTIVGGVNIKRQIEALKSKPHIIVGTPGRVLELIQKKKIKAHQVKTIVIDEADKLLSDSNLKGVQAVMKTTLRDHQVLAFSASLQPATQARALALMKEATVIDLSADKPNMDIDHLCLVVERRKKIIALRKLLHAVKPKKALVFINRNELIQEVVEKLNYHHIKAEGIFGNASKVERKAALDAFKKGKATVLIASDLLARGLDLPDLTHVIHLDLPGDVNEYIHRAGRTGRAGKKGTSISLISENEINFLLGVEQRFDIEFTVMELSRGQLVEREE
jgi:superfamily II DNA/RNA helicase